MTEQPTLGPASGATVAPADLAHTAPTAGRAPVADHTDRSIPRWTTTSTIPPAAQALADLAARAAGPGEDADAVAYSLYEQIRQQTASVSGLEETRGELYACRALLRVLQQFAGGRALEGDDTARRVYATIGRFNLGDMFRPGGGADRYLIPLELTGDGPATPEDST